MDAKQLAQRSIEIMATGTRADFDAVVHPAAVNREGDAEPPEARGTGPAAWYATAEWLRAAFADLHYDIDDCVVEGDLVAVRTTMTGRHVGPFVIYDEDADVKQAFPPTGRSFAVTQSHWLRISDGKVIEHRANRDDMAMAEQLGWVPPSPVYLFKMAAARRAARRSA
ncbi:MAG TPA: ester cyclase [Aldersonia sp.]